MFSVTVTYEKRFKRFHYLSPQYMGLDKVTRVRVLGIVVFKKVEHATGDAK